MSCPNACQAGAAAEPCRALVDALVALAEAAAAIVQSARQGDPNAQRFVAGVLARSGEDPLYLDAAASLTRAARVATRDDFTNHYRNVARAMGAIR